MPEVPVFVRQSVTVRPPRRVPVEDLRREFEASGLTCAQLARRLGWFRQPTPSDLTERDGRRDVRADGARVRRVLGYKAQEQGHGYGTKVRDAVNARTAAAIREALRDV